MQNARSYGRIFAANGLTGLCLLACIFWIVLGKIDRREVNRYAYSAYVVVPTTIPPRLKCD